MKETSVFWFYQNIIKSKNVVPFLRRCHQNSSNKRSTESRKLHPNPKCNFDECNLHSKIYKNLNPSIIQQISFSSSSNNVSCSGDGDIIPIDRIRNFSIIAHVDHGKSTLADRFLELTGAIEKNSKKLVLDSLRVEQERGITVKAQAVTLFYRYNSKNLYMLNLIDTPGHVDFSSEVSRSLSVCDGVILLVDASQGIQAQTIANFELAKSKNLVVIPAINKIDMKNANPDAVCEDLKSFLGIEPSTVRRVSAKIGTNVEQLLIDVINCIPPPKVNRDKRFRALCFDSWYDRYRGALNLVYVNDGQIKIGNEIKSSITSKIYSVKSLSILRPNEEKVEKLVAGQVGLIGCNMRTSKESIIGDTYHLKTDEVEPLHRFEMPQPMVFAGVYPADMSKHVALRSAIEKLVLNDSAVTVTVDSSPALGQGWRLGFLGILHMEVFCQRLEQEFDAEPIIVAPSITYKLKLRNKKLISQHGTDTIYVSNALLFPDPSYVEEYAEPFVKGTIISPSEYLGPIMGLCVEKRGILEKSTNIDNDRIIMVYTLPLCEIILDFNDRLKSISSGYASFNYENCGYHPTSIVRLDIRLNGQVVEEFSRMSHTSKVQNVGRDMVLRLKELIPRQMIQISIQACVGGKVIARETIKPYRKDVTAKLYGGDVTRRMKLLRQQAEGKKKMKSVASIQVPHDTYVNLLKK